MVRRFWPRMVRGANSIGGIAKARQFNGPAICEARTRSAESRRRANSLFDHGDGVTNCDEPALSVCFPECPLEGLLTSPSVVNMTHLVSTSSRLLPTALAPDIVAAVSSYRHGDNDGEFFCDCEGALTCKHRMIDSEGYFV
jgi:hypothetical protein